MTENAASRNDRPTLPRDVFRDRRSPVSDLPKPVVVTPVYHDDDRLPEVRNDARHVDAGSASETRQPRKPGRRERSDRNPFNAYGERTSSRPYALRLPDAVDLVVRQLAAEGRTHPLRVIDRILYDHLKRIGRLPPPPGG